jgi:D-serine deaminase-like pyridoxal phosphate-dependent protein
MTTPTPALIIDLPTVKRNIAKLAAYAEEHRIALRPHTKTHKSLRMAKMQLDAGAKGLTVAKAGEAATMGEVCRDIFVAYPALDPWRREHLAKLARTHAIRVGIDSTDAADLIGAAARQADVTIGVLVDIDVGHHRTGVQSPEQARDLARRVGKTKGLRFDGLMLYPGHLKHPYPEQAKLIEPIVATLNETLDLLRRDGLEAKTVSGGSTPAAYQSHLLPMVNEIRPGTYIYNDMSTVSVGYVSLEDCAARMTCTVISTAVPGKFVIDAGSKTLTNDRRTVDPDTAGYGHVVEYPDAKIVRLTEEHGEVELGTASSSKRPKIGERVHVIPNHICPCVNLQTMTWLRDERGELEPIAVDARGQVW